MPSPDIIWGAALAAFAAIVAWAIAQIRESWLTQQRMQDHIAECDKRASDIWERLSRMDDKLDGIQHKLNDRWWKT